MGIDSREFRRAIGRFATGVTIITVNTNGSFHGMTANAVTSLSLDPLLVLVCISRRARMCRMIVEARRFAINILNQHQEPLSRHFAGELNGDVRPTFVDVQGVPVLEDSLASLICTVNRVINGGDHIIVVGRVDVLTDAESEEQPLLFYAGSYHQIAVKDEQLLALHYEPALGA
jgi:flavin reductase (DIM6/NTAB) family NADH-FMN oxidoreductase RutF